MNDKWTPKGTTDTPLNDMLDEYVAKGAPVDHGWRGWVGLAFVALVILLIVGFVFGVYRGFGCIVDINCLTWLR